MIPNPLLFFFLLATPPQGGSHPATSQPISRPAAKPRVAPTQPTPPKPSVNNTKTAKAVPKVASSRPTMTWLPAQALQRNKQVKVSLLPQSTLAWCYANQTPHVVRLRVAIAAGSSNDPRNLRGRSRFLAKLLAYRLGRPENPAKSPLPVGGARYNVSLQKDWVSIDVLTSKATLPTILKHIAQRLAESPLQNITSHTQKQIRAELSRSAFGFPTVSLGERVDAFFYANHARGAYLRGQRRTFQSITPTQLLEAHKKLYRGEKMRVLIVGDASCPGAFQSLQTSFASVQGKGPLLYPPTQAPENLATSQRGRFFLTQDLLFAYLLPSLKREDALPLDFLLHISKQEIKRAFLQRFGEAPRTKHILRAHPQSGYALWMIPLPSVGRPEMRDLLQKAVGNLLMSPYEPPSLTGLIDVYRQELALRWSEKMASSQTAMESLWKQMRLPSHVHYAYDWRALSQHIATPDVRNLARRYLRHSSSFQRGPQAFSLQRVVLFIGSLLMLWFLLDLMIRRARRYDD